jgi:hypothetical protein
MHEIMNYSRLLNFSDKFSRIASDSAYEQHLTSRLNSEEGIDIIKDELSKMSVPSNNSSETEIKLSNLTELFDLAQDLSLPSAMINDIRTLIENERLMVDVWKVYESSDKIINELKSIQNPIERVGKASKYEKLLLHRIQRTNSGRAAELFQEIINKIIDVQNESEKDRAEYLVQNEYIDALEKEIRQTNIKSKDDITKLQQKAQELESSLEYSSLKDKLKRLKEQFLSGKAIAKLTAPTTPNEKLNYLLKQVDERRNQRQDIKKNPKTDRFPVFKGY